MRASERFFSNVLWNWLGVGVNIASGVLFTPFLIRRLGPEGYGIWALAFAMVEYFWLGDLGFRSATLKFTAEYRARQDADSINAVINAALAYFGVIALVLCALTGIVAANAGRLFTVSAANHAVFERVVLIAGWNWALSLVFQTFRAGLEAFQRFDLDSRVWMAAAAFRLAGSVALLLAGFGIIELALMVAVAQAAGYAGTYYCFRRVFPEPRLSPRLASTVILRRMLGYGAHTFTAVVSLQALGQSAAVLNACLGSLYCPFKRLSPCPSRTSC